MKTKDYILFFAIKACLVLCFLLLSVGVSAKKTKPVVSLTAEEQQRFYYYFYAAEWAFNNERYDDAYRLYCFCYELNSADPAVNQFLGDYMSAMKLPAYALSYYVASFDADPQNEAIYYRLYQTHLLLGHYDDALKVLDREEQLRGKDAYTALRRYRIYGMKGDGKNALKVVENHLKSDQYNMQFLLLRAELYSILKKSYKKQKTAYESILELDDSNTMILNNYAYLLATHNGDLKLAEELSRETIKREPNNCTYLDTYAWILHLRGEDQLAQFYMMQTMKCIAEFAPDEFGNKEIQDHYKAIMEKKKK